MVEAYTAYVLRLSYQNINYVPGESVQVIVNS
jgi:hypothetical protein